MKSGEHVGPFTVVGALGAGGMGEVWRATDTRLGRQVALKLLPDGLVADQDRHDRFEREAKVLAALNHPNIAVLFGLEHLGDRHALVMELVEGENLAARLARGPMPPDDALAAALQVASALDAAHDKGIVHRDLKPGNVMLAPDGTVKVLDFGLAKAWDGNASSSNPSLSPTITSNQTREGIVLGTAAYMSPEQARGKPVDRRTDIWAFGCLLYEMLAGAQAFSGETVTDVIAAVVTRDPDWSLLPQTLRPRTLSTLRRCLDKDPKRRYRDIADVRFDLEDALSAQAPAAAAPDAVAPATPRATSVLRRLGAPVGVVALLAAGGGIGRLARPRPAEPPVVEFAMAAPADTAFHLDPERPGPAVVSPDGAAIAFTADRNGPFQLYVRPLGSTTARPVPGTESAQYPFWSPDSRSLGYFAEGKLRKVQVMGSQSPPVTLCEVEEMKGASWSPAGVIVFAPSATSPLMKVPDTGGAASPVTTFDPTLKEDSHRHPRFLPDGRHFLYLARMNGGSNDSAVMVGSLDGGPGKLLLHSPAAAQYASGHLLFVREGTLMAQRFDPGSLTLSGEAVPVAEDVNLIATATSLSVFSASDDGVLTYQAGGAQATRKLVWHDRDGREVGTLGDQVVYYDVSLSRSGDQAVVTLGAASGNGDVWLYDVTRSVRSRITFDTHDEWRAVWSPDGRTLAFASDRKGHYDLYSVAVGGSQPEQLLYASDQVKVPCDVSADGRLLLYQAQSRETGWDLLTIPLAGGHDPEPFVTAANDQGLARFSPDGRWVAYVSNESGHLEVFVAPFPGPGRRLQVSTRGGYWPAWRGDGREIFYLEPDGALQAVTVEPRGDTLSFGMPKRLFALPPPESNNMRYSVTADGSRFLSIEPVATQLRPPLTVVVNWPARLSR